MGHPRKTGFRLVLAQARAGISRADKTYLQGDFDEVRRILEYTARDISDAKVLLDRNEKVFVDFVKKEGKNSLRS